jgi:cysteinyl-tRNA synthetase
MTALKSVGPLDGWTVGQKSQQHVLKAKPEGSAVSSQQPGESWSVKEFRKACYDAMNDDFNSPIMIAQLFDAVRVINLLNDGKMTLSAEDLLLLSETFQVMVTDILGLNPEDDEQADDGLVNGLMETILTIRKDARDKKDFATSDMIRDELARINIRIKDTKDGAVWEKF